MIARSAIFTCVSAIAIACTGGRAAAAETTGTGGSSQPQETTQLKEVVVTAEKRQESLLRAPLAVSAVSQAQLQDAGVVGLQNLTSTVPNLEMRTTGFADAIQLTIRGITNDDYNEPGNAAVATYIDGVYIGHTTGLQGALYDLARIEVLRGPQGTLYGRNATGGNINIVTADPKSTFGAFADVSYGNYDDMLVHGMINVPVTETLALRGSFVVHRNDGYVDTKNSTSQNYDLSNDFGGRVTALWKPTDNFRWRLAVDDFVSQGTPELDYDTAPDGRPSDGQPVFDRTVPSVPAPMLHNNNLMVRSRMDLDMSKDISISYIAGYQRVQTTTLFANTAPVVGDATFDGLREFPDTAYSHELDIRTDVGRLRNITGATYFHQVSGGHDDYHLYSADTLFGVTNTELVTNKAWGIFDQATFGLTDNLRLIGGIRYSSETESLNEVDFHFCSPLAPYLNVSLYEIFGLLSNGPGCAASPQAPISGQWSNVSWKGGVEYNASDRTSTYATVTTGFKSGGVNPGLEAAGQGTYKPEQVTNYEIGVKTRLLDNTLSVNSALFYEDYKDLQVTQLFGVITETANAARARIYGVENELEWNITGNDRLSGFVNYLHAAYTSYPGAVNALDGTVYADLAGHYLPHSPRWSARLQYAHDFILANNGTITPMAAIYGETTSYLTEFNLPIDRVGGYTKTNLNLTYTDPTGHWKAAAFVDNLENKAIRTQGFVVVSHYFSDYAPPRTYGVRVSYEY